MSCIVATVALGIACCASAGPSGQIAYVSGTEQEDLRVCVIDLETKRITPVGPGQRDGAPVWSPDGAWLAFESARSGGLGITLARPDGSETRTIPHRDSWNRWPQWSPDGKKLTYSAGDTFTAKLMVYDLETNAELEWGGGVQGLLRPAWMSSSSLVALVLVEKNGARSTDIARVTETEVEPLREELLPSHSQYFEWAVAPNIKYSAIAFESNDGGDREIFVLGLKEKGIRDVSNHRDADWNPVWSPDSRSLAFESFRSGRRGIYRVYPLRARVFEVAASADYDNWHPSWSPDGKWIAHVSNRTGDPELFITHISGSSSIRLTQQEGPDYAPAWCPKGRK